MSVCVSGLVHLRRTDALCLCGVVEVKKSQSRGGACAKEILIYLLRLTSHSNNVCPSG